MRSDLRRRATAMAAVLLLLGLTQLPAAAAVTSVYVGSFYFSTSSGGPSSTPVTVDNGDQLRFVAQDNGHTVEIPGLGISQALTKGQTFTTGALMKAGTYALYCSPHRTRGHETTLTVRAAAAQEPSPEPPPPAPSPEPSPEPRPSPTAKDSPAPGKTAGTTASSAPAAGSPMPSAVGSSTGSTPSPVADATAPPAASGSSASPSADAPVAGGLGTASEDEVAVPAAEGSLEDLLGRPAAKEGSWTRSVWMATSLLLPMIALAAFALARRERTPEEPEQP